MLLLAQLQVLGHPAERLVPQQTPLHQHQRLWLHFLPPQCLLACCLLALSWQLPYALGGAAAAAAAGAAQL
jgi:hypothetical protein